MTGLYVQRCQASAVVQHSWGVPAGLKLQLQAVQAQAAQLGAWEALQSWHWVVRVRESAHLTDAALCQAGQAAAVLIQPVLKAVQRIWGAAAH
jgi:hypothetical protein